MSTFVPEISVIIPMYNAEKYIAECLESILAQTFTNFEVIIVDDCSTDSSCAIVESYRERFGGRLTVLQLNLNTGSGAVPRNAGLKFARGEYVFFADADDLLTLTALEELYTLAEKFDSDVVYCESYYKATADLSKIIVESKHPDSLVNEPTLESEDLAQRIRETILQARCWAAPWNKFVRRQLLLEHEIFFPHCTIAEDTVWTYGLIFFAKNFLRVPNVTYIYRQSKNSVIRTKRTPQQWIDFWFNPLLYGLKTVEEFISRSEFFQQNPKWRYDVLDRFINSIINSCFDILKRLEPFVVCEALEQQFGENFGQYGVLFSVLITKLIMAKRLSELNQKQFQQRAAATNERIAQLEAELRRLKS